MFPIHDKKDFENFLILSMIVSFALTLLSRGSSSWPGSWDLGTWLMNLSQKMSFCGHAQPGSSSSVITLFPISEKTNIPIKIWNVPDELGPDS